ncbi:MAG: M28 family peptidase [Saprospiraceae bacterium]|nr:M28 family peptidase [Saprospiraceae bacterium]
MKYLLLSFLLISVQWLVAQTNMLSTSSVAEQVVLGSYSGSDYLPATPTPVWPEVIAADLQAAISPDSLKAYILKLASFKTRNSGSDTVSATEGFGAARRWAYQKFAEISAANDGRLIPSYLQFDLDICGVGQHRNIFAVLPGSVPGSGVVLVEGHMDSRCDILCDVTCLAEGVEDNATGTALVLESARILSKYQFPNTIVFLITTAEEQGLLGADAFATYAMQKNIPLRAVLNNDVIGGVLCGQTSSPPSCPGLDHVDSTSVRLFSAGGFNSKHKQLARFIKLEYQENMLPLAEVPMNVRIMSPEDRTGRGGDHIPFREKGYPAMRFTSANEHGDASNGPGYSDRQHTSEDILGADTNNDGAVDSFFVDFQYLSRNALINSHALAMAARNVALPPTFSATRTGSQLNLFWNSPIDTHTIRVALRSLTNDWDTVYTISPGLQTELTCNPTGPVYVSVAGVDAWGVESLFSAEKLVQTSDTETPEDQADASNYKLFQNRPNPFDEATWISFWVNELPAVNPKASIQIFDLQGKLIQEIQVSLKQGLNEVLYTHGYGVRGTFSYVLQIGGKAVDARQMVFAN